MVDREAVWVVGIRDDRGTGLVVVSVIVEVVELDGGVG